LFLLAKSPPCPAQISLNNLKHLGQLGLIFHFVPKLQ
jgi:hypothetical protein